MASEPPEVPGLIYRLLAIETIEDLGRLAPRIHKAIEQDPSGVYQQAFPMLAVHFMDYLGSASTPDDQSFGPFPQIESPKDTRFLLEIEKWNVLGAPYLTPDRSHLAEQLYIAQLRFIRQAQAILEVRLHKGTPYHMIGTAKFLQGHLPEAREYFLLAAIEDRLTDPDSWSAAPAARTLDAIWHSEADTEQIEAAYKLAMRRPHRGSVAPNLAKENPELLLLGQLPVRRLGGVS